MMERALTGLSDAIKTVVPTDTTTILQRSISPPSEFISSTALTPPGVPGTSPAAGSIGPSPQPSPQSAPPDASPSLEASWKRAADLGKRALQELRSGNSTPETALGVVLFGCLYLHSWMNALEQAEAAARTHSRNSNRLDVWGLVWLLCTHLASMWLLIIVIAVALLVLDKLLVSVLRKTMNPPASATSDTLVPLGLRIAFAWMLNPRVLLVIILSFGVTLAAGVLYMGWLDARHAGAADRVLAVRAIMTFNLVSLAALLVAQVWLDAWWCNGVRVD